ncbi:MAG: efflux RND transporter periplasmic adaptor subunit [Deltaproteobacteria bacterium]|nr:efflux RND transporter periplasmic adaptor subunit [Deltaproteobacteria bacterium]
MSTVSKLSVILLTALLAIVVPGCSKEAEKTTVRVPTVTVSVPIQTEAQKHLDYTGTTAALEYVDIRARVTGFLQKINFEPKQKVKTGDLLFVIDPRQYQAAVNEAEAQLESKKASFKLAQLDEEIAKTLESKEAISWLKLQQATARSAVSKADVDLSEANIEQAKLNLEYTQVTSPIDGRVSRNLVDVGNLVGATEKTLLTTVVNDESVYCYFNVSELDLLFLKRMYPLPRRPDPLNVVKIQAFLGLADEEGFSHEGRLDFTDTTVNPSTGTIQFRAIFPNPNGLLLPGMFARIRIPLAKFAALLVPEAAIQFDQGGRYLLVVDSQNIVRQKRIKMGQEEADGMRVIDEGLLPEDRVIISGLQKARPGSAVNPVTTSNPSQDNIAQPQEKSGKK